MPPTAPAATPLAQLRALVDDDAGLREALFRPDDDATFVTLAVAHARAHGLALSGDEVEAAMCARPAGRFAPAAVTTRLPPTGWLPSRAAWHAGELLVEWLYFGGRPLREPFFENSVARCRHKPFNRLFGVATPIGALTAARGRQVQPSGLIFHMSRCGSTLVAQMLAAMPQNRVVSEASPIDAVVQARQVRPDLSEAEHAAWLGGIVGAFGQFGGGAERHLVLKLDAWHTLALPLFRRAFPRVPWVFLYREPVEVLVSQIRQPGIHTVLGLIDPDAFGIDASLAPPAPEDYRALVLAAICDGVLQHGGADEALFINYRQLPSAAWTAMMPHFGLPCSDDDRALMAQAARYDAKKPYSEFVDDGDAKHRAATPAVRAAAAARLGERYDRLESLRVARQSEPRV